jgi:hypothetical protein
VTLLASAAAQLPHLSTSPSIDFVHGRALTALPVYAAPSERADVKARLWPDTIVSIRHQNADWYALENGYAKRESLQPVVLKSEVASVPALPFWAEVGGAVAAIRQWCAADAPLVARIGHGGVAQVVDRLPGSTIWYGLADEDGFLGWSQAAPWLPVSDTEDALTNTTLLVDTSARQIHVLEDEEEILDAPIALGADVQRGSHQLKMRRHSVKSAVESASIAYGAPWQLDFGSFALSGAYWHNKFGKPEVVPGSAVQVTPPVARWLFGHTGDDTIVVVR